METDWTIPRNLHKGDHAEEQRLRHMRNVMIKDQLQEGRTVQYRSSGNSLFPIVHSNDVCMYEPVLRPETIREGDIVFCEVQPGDRIYAHKVHRIYWDNFIRYFDIGNNHDPPPGINGWCQDHHIYGRLIKVVRE